MQEVHAVSERVRALELKQRVVGSPFSPTSVAEVYREVVTAGKVKILTVPEWWSPAVDGILSLQDLPPPLQCGAAEKEVQDVMEYFFRSLELPEDATVCLLGRSTGPSFGTRKPDVVGYLALPRSSQPAGRGASRSQTVTAASRTAVHIVCLGEAKCRRYQNAEGLFTDQEKGHTVSFAEALVREQPWRAELLGGDALSFARVVTFITDSVHIVFFQCTFAVKLLGQLSVELSSLAESPPLLLRGVGGAFLAGLACVDPGQIGYGMPACVVDGTAATLHSYLGMGATACGFAATWRGEPVVVKIMRPSLDHSALEMEEHALRALESVPGVVKLVAREGSNFLLKPLGTISYSFSAPSAVAHPPLAGRSALWQMNESPQADLGTPLTEAVQPAAADFCALVDVLSLMHTAGYVHRDPRPVNFFRTASGAFFVADLGSAMKVGTTADGDSRPFGFTYGPVAVLNALTLKVPLPAAQPAHDMEQVARLVYAALARDGSTLSACASPAELLEWWRLRDVLEPLATLLPLARAACVGDEERDAFKGGIRKYLL